MACSIQIRRRIPCLRAAVVGVLAMLIGARAADDPAEAVDRAMEQGRWGGVLHLVERRLTGKGDGSAMDRAPLLHVKGSALDRLGRHAEAVEVFAAAMEAYGKGLPGEGRAACADEAGRAAQAAGDFLTAEKWLRQAAEERATLGSAQQAMAAVSRAQWADVLLKMGRVEAASAALHDAEREASGAPAAQRVVQRQWAVFFQATGAFGEALQALEQASGTAKQVGADRAELAALDDLRGEALFRLGRHAEAETAFQQALGFWKSEPGREDEALAEANNLATLWLENGRAGEALTVLREALNGVPEADRPDRIAPWLNRAVAEQRTGDAKAAAISLGTARVLAGRGLPAAHPLRARLAEAGAALAADAQRTAEAQKLAAEASDQALAWLRQISAFADEKALLDFRRSVDPISPSAAFRASDPMALLDVVLQAKGAALEQALRLSKWSAAAGPQAAAEWRALTAGRDMATADTALNMRLNQLRLSGRIPAVPDLPKPSAAALVAQLPVGTTWVEFVQWKPYAGRGTWDAVGRYGALILKRDNPPQWVDLASSAEIDARVRRTIASARDTVVGRSGRAGLPFQTGDLWRLVWGKIAPLVPEGERLVLRPDGMLHFVPWTILHEPAQGGDRAAGEGSRLFLHRYSGLQIPASPRPCARQSGPPSASLWRICAVSAAPAAGAPKPPLHPPAPLTAPLWNHLRTLPPLPGAKREIEAIRSVRPPYGEKLLEETAAKERSFGSVARNCQLLHFCGHGFSVEAPGSGDVRPFRSGLVFANCGDALRALAAGQTVDHRDDGLLFSSEAAALDLDGVELVTLSACQTGLGEPETGDHLTGPRRAFAIAGAANVASTLWDLDDAKAPELVARFYRHFAAGQSPADALWAAQREWWDSPEARALPMARRAALMGAWILESAEWTP